MTGSKHLGTLQLLALTCPALGIQIFWSTMASQIAPLLREHGLPHIAIAGVLVSQPLAGTMLAPILGAMMDLSNHPWGRRTPMILIGLFAVTSLLVATILQLSTTFQVPQHGATGAMPGLVLHRFNQTIVVVLVAGLGFAIQPLHVGLRCLVVDQTPSHQHDIVGACMTFFPTIGAIIAFSIASLDLCQSTQPTASLASFSRLALVAACALVTTVGIAVTWVSEWTREIARQIDGSRPSYSAWRHLRTVSRALSPTFRVVYNIQVLAWMTWFSILFYTSTYISELSLREVQIISHDSFDWSTEAAKRSMRAGFIASLASSVFSLLTSAALLVLMLLAKRNRSSSQSPNKSEDSAAGFKLWAFSQAFTAVLLFFTVSAKTSAQGTAIIAILGITWAIGQWAPFTIMNAEVGRQRTIDTNLGGDYTESTGAVLGLYNAAISGPQILSGMICMTIYAMTDAAGCSAPTAWVLAFSGCTALASSFLAYNASRI